MRDRKDLTIHADRRFEWSAAGPIEPDRAPIAGILL